MERRSLKDQLREVLLSIPDVIESPGIFEDGMAFWVNAKQMANFLDEGRLSIRLSRPLIREHRELLKADPRVDPLRASSDWIGVSFTRAEDVVFIRDLVELAAAIYRPADGSPSRPPPTSPDLERRRRFH